MSGWVSLRLFRLLNNNVRLASNLGPSSGGLDVTSLAHPLIKYDVGGRGKRTKFTGSFLGEANMLAQTRTDRGPALLNVAK